MALGAIARLVKLSKQLVSQRLACQCVAPRYRWALRVPGRGDNKTPSVLKNLTMSTPALWYYHKDGRGFGPVEEADIRELLEHEELATDTLVWRDGLSNWTEAQSTELGDFSSDPALSPPPISTGTPSRRGPGKVSWSVFVLAEIFNGLIFGVIPLFVALVLSVVGANTGR